VEHHITDIIRSEAARANQRVAEARAIEEAQLKTGQERLTAVKS
jgi:hypothetical protein